MSRLTTHLRRLWCRVAWHARVWERHARRPWALVCARCGRREERGVEYLARVILGGRR